MKWLNHWVIVLSMGLLMLVAPQQSFAKTYAYFIGSQGKIAKLDTDTNSFTQLTLKIPAGVTTDKILGANLVTNHIYLTHCVRLGSCKVGVYGLKTLNFVKELPLESLDPDIQMVIYPDGSKFLIQYFAPGEGEVESGYTTDLYDAKTLSKTKNLETIFAMEEVMFSPDGKKIYSIIGGDNAKVDIIDSSSFQRLESHDLTKIWRNEPAVFSSGIESFGYGKILFYENVKDSEDLPNKLDLSVYNITTKAVSPRISTKLQGNAILSTDGTKIVFDENEYIREMIEGKNRIMGFKSVGRLHIYEVSTGNKLGTIPFTVKGSGKVLGIRPAGDRLYYESEGDTAETSKITVINIKTYSVVTSFPLPFKVLSTVFVEE